MKFLLIEPFFGGSHKEFALGLAATSSHDIDLLTLPDQNWGWRMKGAALHFAKYARQMEAYDGIVVTDLMRLSDLKAVAGPSLPPALLYFHENQITYPLAPGGRRDVSLCMGDVSSALCADRVVFNSHFHKDAFMADMPKILNRMPDYPANWVVDAIQEKSKVLYPGCNFPAGREPLRDNAGEPPLIIWNHRWNFDKYVESFFYALDRLIEEQVDFRVAFLGESTGQIPQAFQEAQNRYGRYIVQFGYAETRQAYIGWLKKGKIVVSSAKQENFGISMVEAMRYGCLPLLPDRLAYPEVLPARFHHRHLYRNQRDFNQKLLDLITWEDGCNTLRREISHSMERYTWKQLIPAYDRELERLALASGGPPGALRGPCRGPNP